MSNKLCGIYCIENTINNKKYIGMSRDIKRRWYEHKTELKHHEHNNIYLQHAWDKYGCENFKFYVIELCAEKLLSERECYYIELYNSTSHKNGYNLTHGGENTSIGRLVICLKNKKIFEYVNKAAEYAGVTVATMSIWCNQNHNYAYLDEFNLLPQEKQEYWFNFDWDKYDHERLSKAHSKENLSEETIKKMSESIFGSKNPRAYKVYCPQLNEVFDCALYATQKYGVNRGSISQCIKGKLKTAGVHPITGERLTWEKV